MATDDNIKIPSKWQGWANAYSICSDLKNAIAILKTAHIKFPDHAGIVYNLACYLCRREDFSHAKDWLNKSIRMDNKYEEMAKNDIDLFPLFTKDL